MKNIFIDRMDEQNAKIEQLTKLVGALTNTPVTKANKDCKSNVVVDHSSITQQVQEEEK